MNVYRRRRRPNLSQLRRITRPAALALGIAVAMGVVLPATGRAAEPTESRIEKNSYLPVLPTDRTSGTAGAQVFDIFGQKAVNGTEFNSFGTFQLVKGDTVNFNIASGNTNVVNLVWDSQAFIGGTVNSYLLGTGNQKTAGGNVFFADPHGIVVSSDAVLNVGSLSLSAPTQGFMTDLLQDINSSAIDHPKITALLQGAEQLGGTASTGPGCTSMICVSGTVNAQNAIRIRATTIDVDGKLKTTGLGTSSLATAVNITDADGEPAVRIDTDKNTIRLVAEHVVDAPNEGGKANEAAATATLNVSQDAVLSTGDLIATAFAKSSADLNITAAVATTGSDKTIGQLWKERDSFADKGLASTVRNILLGEDPLTFDPKSAYVLNQASAKLNFGGKVVATGDVTLASATETSTQTTGTQSKTTSQYLPVAAALVYGGLDSRAHTDVGTTANIQSDGTVSISATTDNDLAVLASTRVPIGFQGVAQVTATVVQAKVDADTNVTGSIKAKGLVVDATNNNSFVSEAATYSDDGNVAVNAVAAVMDPVSRANATLKPSSDVAGYDIGGDGVIVNALSNTESNSTTAFNMVTPLWILSKIYKLDENNKPVDPTEIIGTQSSVNTGSLETSVLTAIAGAATGKLFEAIPIKVSGALTWANSEQTAVALVADNTKLKTTGNLVVNGVVVDTKPIGNSSTGVSAADKEDPNQSPIKIAAAVNYASHAHNASALIGNHADVTAVNIGVRSFTDMPFDWTFGTEVLKPYEMGKDFDSFKKGMQFIKDQKNDAKNMLVSNATAYAAATTEGNDDGGDIGVAGSVTYVNFTNNSRAWVGEGAKLVSTAATKADDSWETKLSADNTVKWSDSITVNALNNIQMFSLTGDVRVWEWVGEAGAVAVGGAFNYFGINNTTNAGVASGAQVTSQNNDASVAAKSEIRAVAVTPVTGKGATASIQGSVALTNVTDATHASVSAGATVSSRALDVRAENPLFLWAIGGSLSQSETAAVGIGVGINRLETDTKAYIGDNHKDGIDPTSTATQTGGLVSVSQLGVNAQSDGQSGALSIAGSVSKPAKDTGDEDKDKDGNALVGMIKKVGEMSKGLETGLRTVDSAVTAASGDPNPEPTLLNKAGDTLHRISDGADKFGKALEKVTSSGDKAGQAGKDPSGEEPAKTEKGGFGIAISGAAAVNLAKIGTTASIDGAHIEKATRSTQVTVQSVNNSALISAAGAAALSLGSKDGSGGNSASIGGAVAYSKIEDNTRAEIANSKLINTPQVAVRALDGSLQVGIGVGAAIKTGSGGKSVNLAGSVSIAQTRNTVEATIRNSELDGGVAGPNPRSLEVSAYDHSRIGTGAGALSFAMSSGNNGAALGLTYADIANKTSTNISGQLFGASPADIRRFDLLNAQALDSTLIGAGVLSGSGSTGDSNSLSGAFIWNSVANEVKSTIGDGVRLDITGSANVRSASVKAGSDIAATKLEAILKRPSESYGYDFEGAGLANTGTSNNSAQSGDPTLDLTTDDWGSSIIAVAGGISLGGNSNVGLSFVGGKVSNTHEVAIGNATVNVGGDLSIEARDRTRIIGVAVGAAGGSAGKFTGAGSVTYNDISNTTNVRLGNALFNGESADITATNIKANASDDSRIYSLAGSVAVGSAAVAFGGAVTYNEISNKVGVDADSTKLVAGPGSSSNDGQVGLFARSSAYMMSGAVAGAATPKQTALSLSFGWNETNNDVYALTHAATKISGRKLNLGADNDSQIYTLSGSVAIGGQSAFGAAISVADIGDKSRATVTDSTIDASDSVALGATADGTIYSLAAGAAAAANGAFTGSVTFSTIHNDALATATGIRSSQPLDNSNPDAALRTNALSIKADNEAAISSLAVSLASGGSITSGAGAVGLTIADIGSKTEAQIFNSVLGVRDTTDVLASDYSMIRTAAVGLSAATGNVAGSSSTNLIHNTITAAMTNVGTDSATDGTRLDVAPTTGNTGNYGAADPGVAGEVASNNKTTIRASNTAGINSLAGAVGIGGVSAGVAIAVNRINTENAATFTGDGKGDYRTGSMEVNANSGNSNTSSSENGANINTVSVAGALGANALAGSVSVNLMNGTNTAQISGGAKVIAANDVGVLASNDQGVNVLAGTLAAGGGSGFGVGVVVNEVKGTTSALIDHADVSAYARAGDGISVETGAAKFGDALDKQLNIRDNALNAMFAEPADGSAPNLTGTGAPDLSGVRENKRGVVVNAVNTQHIATLGVGVGASGQTSVGGQLGVNIVGGETAALINASHINLASRNANGQGTNTAIGYNQDVDVRALNRQHEFNRVFEVHLAGGGAALGAGVVTNVFDASTRASIAGSDVYSARDTRVVADADQWSMAGVAGLSASTSTLGGAASIAVNVMKSNTEAVVDGGNFQVGSLGVHADTDTASALVGGAIGVALQGAGIAGVVLVNVNESSTSASVKNGAKVTATPRQHLEQSNNGKLDEYTPVQTADGSVFVTADSNHVAMSAGAGGGLGQYAGIGGVASVHVIGNKTKAEIDAAKVTAQSLAVRANDKQDVDVATGALGVALGVGVGAGLNLVLLQSSVASNVNDSTVGVVNDVSIGSHSERLVDSKAIALAGGPTTGVGVSVGVIVAGTGDISNDGEQDAGSSLNSGGQMNAGSASAASRSDRVDKKMLADLGVSDTQLSEGDQTALNKNASYELNSATGTTKDDKGNEVVHSATFGSSDGIQSNVRNSSLQAGGKVSVAADAKASTSNSAGSLAVGLGALGGSVAYTSVNTSVGAKVSGGSVTAGKGLDVSANAGDGNPGAMVTTHATIGVAGAVGLGAAVAIGRVKNDVSAEVDGTLTGSNNPDAADNGLKVSATDTGTVTSGNSTPSVSIGGIVASAVVVRANRESTVTARVADNATVAGFNDVSINALSAGKLNVQATMGAGGIGASGIGVDARADDESVVKAKIDQGAKINDASTIAVNATARPDVNAVVNAVSVAGVAAVGVSIARTNIGADVQSLIGDSVKLTSGKLDVIAMLDSKSDASSTAATGGIGVSVASADARATNKSTVTAKIGNNVALPTTGSGDSENGNVTVRAESTTLQNAKASGISVAGVLAVGNVVSKATSDVTTLAQLGDGNGQAQQLGSLAITALGTDRNDARSDAGGGALISGNGSEAVTDSTSTTTANLGKNLNLSLKSLGMRAEHVATYGGTANSINVGLVGGAGASVTNTASSVTRTNVGDGSSITADRNIMVNAKSQFGTDEKNEGATGGSGGILGSVASASVKTTLTADNLAAVGKNVKLSAGIQRGADDFATVDIVAATETKALNDHASQTVAGAVPIAISNASLTGNFNSNVQLDDDTRLRSTDRINVATYASIDGMGSEALANTIGLGTVASAKSNITLNSNQSIGIGDRADIFGFGEVDIVAGRDIRNIRSTHFTPFANAQSYARGLIAIPEASATATVNSNANVSLGNASKITSGEDVALGSMIGDANVQSSGVGHGYELGFIPVTKNNSTQNSSGTATTTIYGDVLAGAFDKILVNIDANGNVSTAGSTSPITVAKMFTSPTGELNLIRNTPNATYEGFEDTDKLVFELSGNGLGAPLTVSGGNVYLYGSSVLGNGNANVEARGAPKIEVNNASSGYLILPTMAAKFGTTGQVYFAGGATTASGVTVTQTPSNVQPSISIQSTYPAGAGAKPGIAIVGEVSNLGGSVAIGTNAGSYYQKGAIRANSVNITVPSGVVTIDGGNGELTAGNHPMAGMGTWLKTFMNRVDSPNEVAAALGQLFFRGYALNPNGSATDNYIAVNDSLFFNNIDTTKLGPGHFATPGTNPSTGAKERTVFILYGGCAAYTNNGADNCYGAGAAGAYFKSIIPSDEGRFALATQYVPLWQAGNVPAPTEASAWTAQSLVVKADTINLNAVVNVGTTATWTVQTTDALKNWIAANRNGSDTIEIPVKDGNGNVLLNIIDAQGETRLIGARYNPGTNQILLNNVNAAGEGSALFDGKIVNTGAGSVRVNSGYGSVTVDNTTGTPLVVNNIYAGSGGKGLVQFTDRNKTVNGRPLITWYESVAGGAAQSYSNAADRTITDLSVLKGSTSGTTFGSSTQYNPLTGMQYVWSTKASIARSRADINWSASSSSGGTAGLKWSDPVGYYRLQTDGAVAGPAVPANVSNNDYVAALSGDFTNWEIWGVHYHGCNSKQQCHYGTHQNGGPDASDSQAYSRWEYIFPTAGTLTMTVTQKADKPIGVEFSVSQANHVTIDSNANILLNGVVSNTHGPTYINATNGASIIQGNKNALLYTHELSMSAALGGSIGSETAPIEAKIVHDGLPVTANVPVPIPTNALLLNTEGGNIYVNVDSGNADQRILASSAYSLANINPIYGDRYWLAGDIHINGTGSLIGLTPDDRAIVAGAKPVGIFTTYGGIYREPSLALKELANAGIDLRGNDISLSSRFGSIGTNETPLHIDTRRDIFSSSLIGEFNAHAYGDIAVLSRNGDLWLGGQSADGNGNWKSGVVSDHGDVTLIAPTGGIYDARNLVAASTLSPEQARATWNKLHLTDGSAMDSVIAGINAAVNSAYILYWQLRDAGSVDGNGNYALTSTAVPIYFRLAAAQRGIDPATIEDAAEQATMAQAFASARYASITQTFDSHLGTGWQSTADFTQHNNAFAFSVDIQSDKYKALINDATWKENQLQYAINVIALSAPTDGQVGDAAPNISARNISLTALNGGIGRAVAPIKVDFVKLRDGTFTEDESQDIAMALAAAHSPGDAILLNGNGETLSLSDPNLASTLKWVSLRQTNPLYIEASGSISGNASGSVYLQTSNDLNLKGIVSGADMRLAAGGSIQAASDLAAGAAALTSGRDATLVAGTGHISFGNGDASTASDPLLVQVNGVLQSAAAKTDLILRQMQGDLRLGTAFGNGLVNLSAPNGSILGTLSSINTEPTLSISGHDITLAASGDIKGPVSNGQGTPLQVQVASDGLLNATAGGAVNVSSPKFALQIGQIDAGQSITLYTPKSGLVADSLVSHQGNVSVTASGDVALHTVQAQTGISASTTAALTAGSLTSTTDNIALDAVNHMQLDQVDAQAGDVTAQVTGANATLNLLANGAIQSSHDVSLNSGGSLDMASGSTITAGQLANLVTGTDMTLGQVTAHATSGTAINLDSGGQIQGNGAEVNLKARDGGLTNLQADADIGSQSKPLVVDVASLTGRSENGSAWLHMLGDISIPLFNVPHGALHATGEQQVNFDQVNVVGTAYVIGSSITGNTLNATNAVIGATGSVNIQNTNVTGVTGVPGEPDVPGYATIDAGTSLTLGTLTATGNANLTAGTNMAVTTLDIQSGNAALSAGQTMTLGTATVHDALTAQAGSSLSANSLITGAGANLTAGTTLEVLTAQVGGALASHSGGDTHIQTGNVASTSTLNAGGNLVLDAYTAGNDVTTHSTGDSTLGNVALTSGNLATEAGNNVSVNTLNVQAGNASLTSGQAMNVGVNSATVSGDATLAAGTTLDAGSLNVGGNTSANVGTDANITSATVGGALALQSGGNTSIGTGTVTGTSDLTAGGNLVLGTYTAGNNVTSHSTGDSTLGNVALTNGNLSTEAGNNVSVNSLTVQAGNANVTSGQAMNVGTAATSGDTTLTAGTSLDANALTVGGNTTASSGSGMHIGTLANTGNAALTAGTSLAAGSLNVGGNTSANVGTDANITSATIGGALALQSGGNTSIGNGAVTGTSDLTAGGNLVLDTYTAGNNVTTHSSGDSTLGAVALTGGNLKSDAGNTLSVSTLEVQAGNADLSSGLATNIGKATVSGNTAANAGTTMDIIDLTSNANATLSSNGGMTFQQLKAGIDLSGTSRNASITGGTATAGRDVSMTALDNVTIKTLTAGRDIRVDSGAAISIQDAGAGHNLSYAGSQIDFGTVNAPNQVDMLARRGSIIGAEIATKDAYIAASNDIQLDAARIGNRVNLQATNINANLYQTSTGQPLYSVLTGYQDGVANFIGVTADVPTQWDIDTLASQDAKLKTTSPNVSIADGTIIHTMDLDTAKASIRMNQDDPRLVKADVQMMEPGHTFQLYQNGVRSLTDAYVIRYAFGYEIQTPNFVMGHAWMQPDYLGESVLRYNGRHLTGRNGLFFDDEGNLILLQWRPAGGWKLVSGNAESVDVNLN